MNDKNVVKGVGISLLMQVIEKEAKIKFQKCPSSILRNAILNI